MGTRIPSNKLLAGVQAKFHWHKHFFNIIVINIKIKH